MPQPKKNGRATPKKKKPTQERPQEFTPLGENQLVSNSDIENMRLRGQNALLNAELLEMRNELIKAKREIERLIDGKSTEGQVTDEHQDGAVSQDRGRSSSNKSKAR